MIWINLKKRTNKEENICIWYDWYDWLINYIPEPKKTVSWIKDQIISLFKTKDYSKTKRVKNMY